MPAPSASVSTYTTSAAQLVADDRTVRQRQLSMVREPFIRLILVLGAKFAGIAWLTRFPLGLLNLAYSGLLNPPFYPLMFPATYFKRSGPALTIASLRRQSRFGRNMAEMISFSDVGAFCRGFDGCC